MDTPGIRIAGVRDEDRQTVTTASGKRAARRLRAYDPR